MISTALIIFVLMFTILWFVIYYRRVSSQLIGKNFSTATISFRDAINFLFKQKAVGVHVKEVYLKYKAAGYKHVCNFNFLASAYVPLDLEVIKTILNKDLNHFTDRGFYSNENCDLLSANLFFVNGQKWQKVRKIISPIFTPKKLKCLVDCLSESSNDLLDTFKKSYDAKEVININDVLNLYALNSFSSCVLGIKDTNTNNEENMLKSVSEKIFEKPSIKRFVKLVISFIKPEVGEYFSIPFFQPEVRNFFEKNIELGIKLRESSGIKRDDILNSLIKLKDDHLNSINGENGIIQEFDENCGLTLNETIAQAFILYVGATDTTGSALLFCIFELCKYPDIQQKLREEINSVLIKHEGKITYDALMDMKYMDLAINETLRKYPPLPILNRRSTKEYTIPDTNITIPRNAFVIIPLLGIHHDPEYYPNPEKFDPERFAHDGKNKNAFNFLPFGAGPRICIGQRVAVLHIKITLTNLLKTYVFKLNKRTHDPIVFNPNTFTLTSKYGVFVDIERIE